MMDAKMILGGKAIRTIVDFATVVLSGIVLTRVVQILWSLAGTNFILGALPWMIGAILIGFLGGYIVKMFLSGWYLWEAIAPIGIFIIGIIVRVMDFDQATYIILLDMLLGLYFWNLACCDVHMRDAIMTIQNANASSWLPEFMPSLLIATGVLLPFMVDSYTAIDVSIIYLVALAGCSVLMIISVKFHEKVPASDNPTCMSLVSMPLKNRAKAFLDGKNIVRAVLLALVVLLLEYYSFQAIQARIWWYGTPNLGFLYDIELYSITYYGILFGAIVAFIALRIGFSQGNHRTARIVIGLTIAVLGPGSFVLIMIISNALEKALVFMFFQPAFAGSVLEFFIALLGHLLQVLNMMPKQRN